MNSVQAPQEVGVQRVAGVVVGSAGVAGGAPSGFHDLVRRSIKSEPILCALLRLLCYPFSVVQMPPPMHCSY